MSRCEKGWVVMDDNFIAYKYRISFVNQTRALRFDAPVYTDFLNLPIQTVQKEKFILFRMIERVLTFNLNIKESYGHPLIDMSKSFL